MTSYVKEFWGWKKNNSTPKEIVILNKKKSNLNHPKLEITIGIPTFKRLKLLERSLYSLSIQSFKKFKVIISNNNYKDEKKLIEICKKFKDKFEYLSIYSHKINNGSLSNLYFLLNKSNSKYFMWLADDDEVSSNYLKELKKILDKDSKIVSAMAQHKIFSSKKKSIIKNASQLSSNYTIIRIFKFLVGMDDAAFYGLHRAKYIKKCTFEGYYWPINNIITNVCYILLFQLTLFGKTEYSDKAEWICHNYTHKYHSTPKYKIKKKILEQIQFPFRRLNVNFLYIKKINDYFKNPLYTLLFVPVAISSFLKDIISSAIYFTARLFKFVFDKMFPA